MNPRLPPLDMHAHVDGQVPQRDLESLGAVVFAATRSQIEFSRTLSRSDQVVVWGLGCHPGVLAAQERFDVEAFRTQITSTPFVSEIGLDSRSKVSGEIQLQTLRAILEIAVERPRILSIHSAGRTQAVLDLIDTVRPQGVILHWWLGTESETRRAVELGCYFSVNHAMASRPQVDMIPHDRLLLETDHPSGDRHSPGLRRPGATQTTEADVARRIGITEEQLRERQWHNLSAMVAQLDLASLFPKAIQRMLTYASTTLR